VLWDEPEQVRGATERFWKRLEQIERSPAYDPDRIYFRWEDLERQAGGGPQIAFRELDIGWSQDGDSHIATRPSMAFHGNMQVAIGEARTLVESGSRVAFFASSTGEVERVADILNEYRIPYQLGLEQFESTPAYLAERAYLAGSVASIYVVKGLIRHGAAFQDSKLVVFGAEDLFETSDWLARASVSKSALATFSADLIRSEARRLRSPRGAWSGSVPGVARDRPRRGPGRLYAPRIRRRRQALCAIDPHGSGPAVAWRGRSQAGARPYGRRHLVAHQDAHQSQNARHGGRAAQALRFPQNGRGLPLLPDSNWQREFEDAFEFTETRDQISAAREIKRDMESPQPMDRLLCGDVGFGKTEVVMRATFKALGDGKQVAVLAPTTVSHFSTSRPSSGASSHSRCALRCSAAFAPPRNSRRLS